MMWVFLIFGVLLLTTITYTQEIPPENSNGIPTSKRIITGQIIDLDPTDKQVIDMAEYTLEKYEFNVGSKYEAIEVVKATMQEVAGTIYRFNFYAKPTHSPMEKSEYLLYCESQLWSRPWRQMMDDVTINCQKEYPVGH